MKDAQESASRDDMEIRCPRLGGPVTFGYCRVESLGRPCFRTILCWAARFPVAEHLRRTMTEAEFCECFSKNPTPKVTSLIELIEKAKKLTEKKDDES